MASRNPSDKARKFIDASLKGRAKRPSKAAYARAVKLATMAIEELSLVAIRIRG